MTSITKKLHRHICSDVGYSRCSGCGVHFAEEATVKYTCWEENFDGMTRRYFSTIRKNQNSLTEKMTD